MRTYHNIHVTMEAIIEEAGSTRLSKEDLEAEANRVVERLRFLGYEPDVEQLKKNVLVHTYDL